MIFPFLPHYVRWRHRFVSARGKEGFPLPEWGFVVFWRQQIIQKREGKWIALIFVWKCKYLFIHGLTKCWYRYGLHFGILPREPNNNELPSPRLGSFWSEHPYGLRLIFDLWLMVNAICILGIRSSNIGALLLRYGSTLLLVEESFKMHNMNQAYILSTGWLPYLYCSSACLRCLFDSKRRWESLMAFGTVKPSPRLNFCKGFLENGG